MTFEQELIPQIKKNLDNIMVVIHGDAIDFAPRGWTNELRQSIYAIRATKRGQTIQASIVAKAEYATKIHDSVLRHASNQGGPAFLSFADFGQSSDAETSYSEGYNSLKDTASKYATKFLDRAIHENSDLLDKLI